MIGDAVQAGDPLAIVHAASEDAAEAIAADLVGAFTLKEGNVDGPSLIYREIS